MINMIIHYHKKELFFIIISIFCVFFFSSCYEEKKEDIFAAPTNLYIDDSNILRWDKVTNATNYEIKILHDGKLLTYYSGENEFDIFEITNECTTYEISVSAIDEINNLETDECVINYNIPSQNDLLTFTLINDDKEYSVSAPLSENIRGKLIIPSEYNGKNITTITNFIKCKELNSIIIPETVTTISPSTFSSCSNLKRVKIPDNINTLSSFLFEDCESLESIIIPDSVTTLDNRVFESCTNLKSIKIGNGLKKIGVGCFGSCINLTNIEIDDLNLNFYVANNCIMQKGTDALVAMTENGVLPANVTAIKSQAYSGIISQHKFIATKNITLERLCFGNWTGLEELIFEEGVETIDYIIPETSIKRIVLPSTVKEIASFYSFFQDIEEIVVDDKNEYYAMDNNCFVDKKNKKLLFMLDDATIPDYIETIGCYAGAYTNVKDIVIPEGVKEIKEYAFYESKIETISFPSSLITIGICAFQECSNLKKVVFKDGIEEICNNAFASCYNIDSLVIPKTVKIIRSLAFSYCFCPIVIYNTIETIEGAALVSDTVYTNFKSTELVKFDTSSDQMYVCPNSIKSLNAFFSNCEIEDGIVKSFNYFNGVIDDNGVTHKISTCSGDIDFKSTIYKLDSRYSNYLKIPYVPCRDGYKFIGYSYTKDSNTIDIPVIEKEFTDEVLLKYTYTRICRYALNKDLKNTLPQELTLYPVWKKID